MLTFIKIYIIIITERIIKLLMASNSLTETFNSGPMNNGLTESYDGARGMAGEGVRTILNHRTMMGESVSDTLSGVGNTYGPSLNNGIGSLANLAVLLTGEGIKGMQIPCKVDFMKGVSEQKLGPSLSSR